MKVRFSMTALLYLRSEQTYIARFNKRAARAVSQQIKEDMGASRSLTSI